MRAGGLPETGPRCLLFLSPTILTVFLANICWSNRRPSPGWLLGFLYEHNIILARTTTSSRFVFVHDLRPQVTTAARPHPVPPPPAHRHRGHVVIIRLTDNHNVRHGVREHLCLCDTQSTGQPQGTHGCDRRFSLGPPCLRTFLSGTPSVLLLQAATAGRVPDAASRHMRPAALSAAARAPRKRPVSDNHAPLALTRCPTLEIVSPGSRLLLLS